jgi:excisionase family DNA binding protein
MTKRGLTLEPLLTPPVLAKALGVHPGKVRAWIESGELEAVNLATSRCGRPRYRVRQDAVDTFLERRKVIPRPVAPRRQRGKDPDGFIRYYSQ